MKKVFKKISLGNVSDTLSDSQLKKVLGGKVLGAIYCACWCGGPDGIAVGGLCSGSSVEECEGGKFGCAGIDCTKPSCKEV